MAAVRERLIKIEQAALAAPPNAHMELFLASEYAKLDVGDDVRRWFRERFHTDTQVVLNGSAETPLTLGASILNRLAVSLLLRFGDSGFRYTAGRIDADAVRRVRGQYHVTADGWTKPQDFDSVVVRHGPELIIGQLGLTGATDPIGIDDPTRFPLWPEGFFEVQAPQPKSSRLRSEPNILHHALPAVST